MKYLVLVILINSQIACSKQMDEKKPDIKSTEDVTPIKEKDLELKLPSSKVSFADFKALVNEVEAIREERLIDLNEFLAMSKQENVVILDTRSDKRYEQKHIKGAIHLDFTDFTQENLLKLIPDQNTKILIYCNNNFDKDPIHFATKMAIPAKSSKNNLALALNIPTYLNLHGYGYRNIYELSELVAINDLRIEFEGTAVLND